MTSSGTALGHHATRLAMCLLGAILMIGWVATTVHAEAITDANVSAALVAAKTPADHQALAAYFTTKAEAAQANVQMHSAMAADFSGKSRQTMATHCKALVKTYEQQVKEYTALAKEQAALAK